jgi:hypothetical protein
MRVIRRIAKAVILHDLCQKSMNYMVPNSHPDLKQQATCQQMVYAMCSNMNEPSFIFV